MGQVRIVSRSSEEFTDRTQAGQRLAAELSEYAGKSPVVLGIPRGGIIVAREIARKLSGSLDVVLAHKLGTPGQPELAMGAVSENGQVFVNESLASSFGIRKESIENETLRQLDLMRRRSESIRKVRPRVALKGRIVIIADDGVATGATTQVAFQATSLEQPERLVAAIPVGPEETISRLAGFVDEMVCLRCPPMFSAVGQFYLSFRAVEDEEMLRVLEEEYKPGQ
jgi:putative phosphoribosyl transferase